MALAAVTASVHDCFFRVGAADDMFPGIIELLDTPGAQCEQRRDAAIFSASPFSHGSIPTLTAIQWSIPFLSASSIRPIYSLSRVLSILCSVIEKALHVIPTQDISGGWMRKTYDYRAKVAQSRLPWLIGALLSVSCVLALLLVLFSRTRREVKRMTQFQNVIMETMAELVEYRDGTTGGHIERTSAYLDLMLREMQARGLYREQTSGWDIGQMVLSAQLHDVGKVAISDSILGKPGKLTAQEFDEMKRHTVIGSEIIRKIQEKTSGRTFLDHARIFALHHHERYDGTGYPDGISGDNIPLEARLMAIIDVYDALISERPYKKAMTHEQALRIITDGRGTHFDPVLTDLFIDVIITPHTPAWPEKAQTPQTR